MLVTAILVFVAIVCFRECPQHAGVGVVPLILKPHGLVRMNWAANANSSWGWMLDKVHGWNLLRPPWLPWLLTWAPGSLSVAGASPGQVWVTLFPSGIISQLLLCGCLLYSLVSVLLQLSKGRLHRWQNGGRTRETQVQEAVKVSRGDKVKTGRAPAMGTEREQL